MGKIVSLQPPPRIKRYTMSPLNPNKTLNQLSRRTWRALRGIEKGVNQPKVKRSPQNEKTRKGIVDLRKAVMKQILLKKCDAIFAQPFGGEELKGLGSWTDGNQALNVVMNVALRDLVRFYHIAS